MIEFDLCSREEYETAARRLANKEGLPAEEFLAWILDGVVPEPKPDWLISTEAGKPGTRGSVGFYRCYVAGVAFAIALENRKDEILAKYDSRQDHWEDPTEGISDPEAIAHINAIMNTPMCLDDT